jgi:hypothetical protein
MGPLEFEIELVEGKNRQVISLGCLPSGPELCLSDSKDVLHLGLQCASSHSHSPGESELGQSGVPDERRISVADLS